jgi:hypothetical protein
VTSPFGPSDWLTLFGQFLLMSMLGVSGASTATSEMHRGYN